MPITCDLPVPIEILPDPRFPVKVTTRGDKEGRQPGVTTKGDKKHIKSLAWSDPRTAWTPSLPLTLVWFALICLVLAVGLPVSGFAQEAFKRHITVYGSSTLLDKYPADIAKNCNLVITEWWKNRSSVANIKKINPAIKIIFYRDLAGMLTSYDDWGEASKHPAWFVRDTVTNKRFVHNSFGWYLMDITNPEFRRHFVQYVQRKLVAYPVFDGVFLDDVPASPNPASFVIEGTTTPATFDPAFLQAYKHAVCSFLQALKAALGTKLVIINGNDYTQYIQYVDGIMLEGLFHGSWQAVDYYEDNVSWLTDMQSLANFLTLNKMVLVHSGSRVAAMRCRNNFSSVLRASCCFATKTPISLSTLRHPARSCPCSRSIRRISVRPWSRCRRRHLRQQSSGVQCRPA